MRAVPLRVLATALVLALVLPLGCITREVKDTELDDPDLKIYLRSHARGFTTIEQDFQHPVRIAPERLANILGAIEIRGREAELAGVRAAFEPSQLADIAEGLSRGLAKANSDQEVVVIVIRKEIQHLIFDRKQLTNFVAYVRDDLLYLHFSLVDSEISDRVKKTSLPEPRVNDHPMKFRVIPSEGMFAEGVYAVSVEWQDPIFARPVKRASADDPRRERTILMEDPDRPEKRHHDPLPSELLPYLTPAQLRELADVEEARQQGRITEGHYRRERDRILQEAREQAATSR
jgi:hypothetical protein